MGLSRGLWSSRTDGTRARELRVGGRERAGDRSPAHSRSRPLLFLSSALTRSFLYRALHSTNFRAHFFSCGLPCLFSCSLFCASLLTALLGCCCHCRGLPVWCGTARSRVDRRRSGRIRNDDCTCSCCNFASDVSVPTTFRTRSTSGVSRTELARTSTQPQKG